MLRSKSLERLLRQMERELKRREDARNAPERRQIARERLFDQEHANMVNWKQDN